ncbi:MAG: hypothetical protein IJI92_07145 [Erysipelotrichaceae bacterium]|nr:hypothetical protein [Erysipelotrichaceae bacterium]
MKKTVIFLLLMVLLAGCATTEEVIKEDDKTADLPVKVVYGRRWIYGANYETEDPELISALVSALDNIGIGDESNYMVTDCTDLVFLYYEDGSSKTYEFEDQCIVQDGKRYYVSGIDGVKNILYLIAEADKQ